MIEKYKKIRDLAFGEIMLQGGTTLQPTSIGMLLDMVSSSKNMISDLHIKPGQSPRFNVYGKLRESGIRGDKITPEITEGVAKTILENINPELMKKFNTGVHTNFNIAFNHYSKEGVYLSRFRGNIFHTTDGWCLVFRHIPNIIPPPEMIGVPENVIKWMSRGSGLILITGPAGSGKSTTVASLIQNLLNKDIDGRHVLTLEDPIEYVFSDGMGTISQREMFTNEEFGFVEGLRGALRQNPGVIFVGEMRDKETIQTVLTIAETGHLVISTLHTRSAANTIQRILQEFNGEEQQRIADQLSNSLIGVINQRLIKSTAQHEDGKIYEKRNAVFEVVAIDEGIASSIRKVDVGGMQDSLRTNRKSGNTLMNDVLCDLMVKGIITPASALKTTYSPSDFRLSMDKYEVPEAQIQEILSLGL